MSLQPFAHLWAHMTPVHSMGVNNADPLPFNQHELCLDGLQQLRCSKDNSDQVFRGLRRCPGYRVSSENLPNILLVLPKSPIRSQSEAIAVSGIGIDVNRITGAVTTVLGNLDCTIGIAFDASGNMYFSEDRLDQVWKLSAGATQPTLLATMPYPGRMTLDRTMIFMSSASRVKRGIRFEELVLKPEVPICMLIIFPR